MHHGRVDLTGFRFGLIEVISPAPSKMSGRKWVSQWHCVCHCTDPPKPFIGRTGGLREGRVRSCGCSRTSLTKRERQAALVAAGKAGPVHRTHGLSKHPLYQLWRNIIARCHHPWCPIYEWYGARGITMYEPWRDVPAPFFEYMETTLGPRPSPKHSLDRIDNGRGYEPGNIRWASTQEQAANKRQLAKHADLEALRARVAFLESENAKLRARLARAPRPVPPQLSLLP